MTDIDGFDLIAPKAYGMRGVPHDQWRALRGLDRLHHCEPKGFDAFYPVVRHDQVCEISKQPDRFLSRFGIVLESAAQKQIIEIARAASSGANVIIMDEPTSALDVNARRNIWTCLKEFKKDRIVLLTTHYMDEADILGDRIGIMTRGKIVCLGSSLFLKRKFGVGYNL